MSVTYDCVGVSSTAEVSRRNTSCSAQCSGFMATRRNPRLSSTNCICPERRTSLVSQHDAGHDQLQV